MRPLSKKNGFKTSFVYITNHIALFAILFTSFYSPAQVDFSKINRNRMVSNFSFPTFLDKTLLPISEDSNVNLTTDEENSFKKQFTSPTHYNLHEEKFVHYSDLTQGSIGINEDYTFDNPKDNVFKFNISEIPHQKIPVLKYSLQGVTDSKSVGLVLNGTLTLPSLPSEGSEEWVEQDEFLNPALFHQGLNYIIYTATDNHFYKVKDVRIEWIDHDQDVVFYRGYPQITASELVGKGFVNNANIKFLKIGTEFIEIINNALDFEISLLSADRKSIQLEFLDAQKNVLRTIENQEFKTNENKTSIILRKDKLFKKHTIDELVFEGAQLILTDSSLNEDKKIFVEKIQQQHTAPLSSGLINITKDRAVYRFLPDGTTFDSPVKISLQYDSHLIPKGYSENDIQTFYFDVPTKSWLPVPKDTLDKKHSKLISFTNHFTDYINGIIQVPESPNTNEFTPTTLSDIKAVSPAQGLQLMSPPNASQTGEASLGYPIAIPAGRKGMQPNLQINYNSEGGSGWLGEGWNLNTPSITIDSRWGVPNINKDFETEIYLLSGEQLMYPMFRNRDDVLVDWMPHRHHDDAGSNYSTSPREKITDAVFTVRKQGSFSKIERLGSDPSNYYWKVTQTDGSIYWYGGKDNATANFVIRNTQNYIVHWALYMVEDVHGNNIKYTYQNQVLNNFSGLNANLNEGLLFHVDEIFYTGFNDQNGAYRIKFNRSGTIRNEPTINVRNGLKQIDPYLLDNVVVFYNSEIIRKYNFVYQTGMFNKHLLTEILQVDAQNNLLDKHVLEYYDDITQSDGSHNFFDSEIIEIGCEPVSENELPSIECYTSQYIPIASDMQSPSIIISTSAGQFTTNSIMENIWIDDTYVNLVPIQNALNSIVALQGCNPKVYLSPQPNTNDFPQGRWFYFVFDSGCGIEFTNVCIQYSLNNPCYNVSLNDCPTSLTGLPGSSFLPSNTGISITGGNSTDVCDSMLITSGEWLTGYNNVLQNAVSSLGSNRSKSWSANLDFSPVGLKCNPVTKNTTFRLGGGYGENSNRTEFALIDIDGDGHEDMVRVLDNAIIYRKHLINRTINSEGVAQIQHSFSPWKMINTNNYFRNVYTHSGSFLSVNFGVNAGSSSGKGGTLSFDRSTSKGQSKTYFTDANGDGLIDVVKNGIVYFNRLGLNDVPTFTPESEQTPNMVITASVTDIEIPEPDDSLEMELPGYDAVKVWEAPVDGVIKITNTISLSDPTKEAIVSIEMNDVQHNICNTVVFPLPKTIIRDFTVGAKKFSSSNGDQYLNSRYHRWTYTDVPDNVSNEIHYGVGSFQLPSSPRFPSNYLNTPLFMSNGNINGHGQNALSASQLIINNFPNNITSNDFISRNNNAISEMNLSYEGTYLYYDSSNPYQAYQISGGYDCNPSGVIDHIIYLGNIISSNQSLTNLFQNNKWTKLNGSLHGCDFFVPVSMNWNAPYVATPTPLATTISIDGVTLSVPYSLMVPTNFQNFLNELNSIYPYADAYIGNDEMVYLEINSYNELSQISLNHGSTSNVYEFESNLCGETSDKLNSENYLNSELVHEDWENVVLGKDYIDYYRIKVKTDSNNILKRIYRNSNDYLLTIYDSKREKYFTCLEKSSAKKWFFDVECTIEVNDTSLLSELNSFDLFKEIEMTDNQIFTLDSPEKLSDFELNYISQYEEKLGYDLFSVFDFQNKDLKSLNSSTSNDLCLLFGTELNQLNTIVENEITLNCHNNSLIVKKGDRIYFRVHHMAAGNSPVNWNPIVEYSTVFGSSSTILDENGLSPYNSNYASSFMPSRKEIAHTLAGNGTATIQWEGLLVHQPSDDVSFEIVHRIQTPNNNDMDVSETVVYTTTAPANSQNFIVSSSAFTPIVINESEQNLSLHQLLFKVYSSSNVNWKNIVWRPQVTFTKNAVLQNENGLEDGTIQSVQVDYPIVDYSLYKVPSQAGLYKKYFNSSLQAGATLTANTNGIQSALGTNFNGLYNGFLYLVVKRQGQLVGKQKIVILNSQITTQDPPITLGSVTGGFEIGFYKDCSHHPIDSQVLSTIEKLGASTQNLVTINNSGTSITLNSQTVNFYQRINDYFGSFYRNWGEFFYNPKSDQLENSNENSVTISGTQVYLIKEDKLSLDLLGSMAEDLEVLENNTTLTSWLTTENPEELDPDQIEANFLALNQQAPQLPFLGATPVRKWSTTNGLVEKYLGFGELSYISETDYMADSYYQYNVLDEGANGIDYVGDMFTGAYGINKKTFSKGRNFSVGGFVSFGGVTFSKSYNTYNATLSDYVDLNGDRYPDVFSMSKIQYTNRTGGLKNTINRSSSINPYYINRNNSSSYGLTASGHGGNGGKNSEPTTQGSSGEPIPNTKGKGTDNSQTEKNSSGSYNASGSLNFGNDITTGQWIDINGDGLSDYVYISYSTTNQPQLRVKLNAGNENFYDVLMPSSDEFISKNNTTSFGLSAGMGFGFSANSITGGLSLGSTNGGTEIVMIDMNGDGLLDRVISDGFNNSISLDLNQGNKISSSNLLLHDQFNYYKNNKSFNLSANGQFTIGFPAFLLFECIKIASVSFGGSGSLESYNHTKKTITDFDGDGYNDLLEYISSSQIRLHRSNIKRTNKLKSVTNTLKGSFELDYEVYTKSYDNPYAKWVLSKVTVHDGYDLPGDGHDSYVSEFTYDRPYYDRRERQFYGFEQVKTIQRNYDSEGQPETAPYRTTVERYHNQNFYLKGLLNESFVIKGDSNELFSRTQNTYELKELQNENQEVDLNSNPLDFTFDVGGTEGRRTAIALLVETTEEIYELGTNPLVKNTKFIYNAKGRVSDYLYFGNPNSSDDNYSVKIDYHEDQELIDQNIIGIPSSIVVKNQDGTVKRKRTTAVDIENGLITQVSGYLNDNNFTTTVLNYDVYGNLTTKIFPINENNQTYTLDYVYDTTLNKYITDVQDSFGYQSQTTYDHKFDQVLTQTDITGNVMTYHYDSFGRVVKVVGPNEISQGSAAYTMTFDYYVRHSDLSGSGITLSEEEFVPFAITNHYDVQYVTNDIQTYTFSDGLGRPIQVKKDIEINNGTPQNPNYNEMMSVSGVVEYDAYGRATKQYHPTLEAKSNVLNATYNPSITNYYVSSFYDEINRTISTVDADGTVSTVQYSIDGDFMKAYSVVPQNNNATIETENYTDINGRTQKTVNIGQSQSLITEFEYSSLGELLSYTDAEGLTTIYTYDNFGRKISVDHPDSGLTTYEYHISGNLTKVQTANLAEIDAFISYEYDYQRLTNINFPDTPYGTNISNVKYVYAGPNSGNNTGRLIEQYDATGYQIFDYGKQGELISNYRFVASPSQSQPDRAFQTSFVYDSWNRIQQINYPDGEEVTFQYNKGGMLFSMKGYVNYDEYEYIRQTDYDHFEQKKYIKYGNNTETTYSYTPGLRRLNHMELLASNGEALFNNRYGYDKIGNITDIRNEAPSNAVNNMGGSYDHTYSYDKFNRLETARGRFTGNPNFGQDYSGFYDLRMTYNATHGIEMKDQFHEINGTANLDNTYTNLYTYYENTHKLQSVENQQNNELQEFKYDLNGNMTLQSKNSTVTNFYWDEVNRLRVVNSEELMHHYFYDASGERVLKATTSQEEVYENGESILSQVYLNNFTTYPSGFIVVEPDGRYTKHYYAGSQRVASQTGDTYADNHFAARPESSKSSSEFDSKHHKQQLLKDMLLYAEKTGQQLPKFKEQDTSLSTDSDRQSKSSSWVSELYFYHPDHLGTSTYVTDGLGFAYQFLLNLPFGETMVEQHSYSNDFDNRYKFNGKELDVETGLYYYGARYYNPQLSIWLSVDPLAEKFSSWNPYNYVMQNPINLIDPTGMEPEDSDPPKRVNVVVNLMPKIIEGKENPDFNAIKKGTDKLSNTIVIETESLSDFYTQLKEKVGNNKIDNLMFVGHGSEDNLNFGSDDYIWNVTTEYEQNKIEKFQTELGTYLDQNSTVATTSCHGGRGRLKNVFQKIANNTGATIFMGRSWGRVSSDIFDNDDGFYFLTPPKLPVFTSRPADIPNCAGRFKLGCDNLGDWTKLTKSNKSKIVRDVYFTKTGNIK